MITSRQFQRAVSCSEDVAAKWLDPLDAAMDRFGINTPARQAAFIAQCAHESARFTRVVENLNYSAAGLLKTFPKYFDETNVSEYARQPEKIANRVYANRMGNGDEASGDGWKNRGKGPIEITGADNHKACGKALGLDLVKYPELLLEPVIGAESSAWFWSISGANKYADIGDFDGVSDVINLGRHTSRIGDSIGYADRLATWGNVKEALGL